LEDSLEDSSIEGSPDYQTTSVIRGHVILSGQFKKYSAAQGPHVNSFM